MTQRRPTKRKSPQRLANEDFAVARKLARDRQKAERQERAASVRQERARQRLVREQEREEALASAAEEHAENEALFEELRELVQRTPSPQRTRDQHEPRRQRRPFARAEREAADRERLERAVAERIAKIELPASARFLALVPWIALGLLLGAGGVMLHPGIAGWILLGAAVLVFAISGLMARAQNERKLASAKAAEAERARAELAPQLADAAERDRIAHERAEEARVAAVEAILGGEGEACAHAFGDACARLDLPLEASAALEMQGDDAAQIQVDLHAGSEIPLQRSTLLKSGRISYRNRPQKDVREDDARAVAGLCIVFAGVAFDELPSVSSVAVAAFRRGVDPATGNDADLCYAAVDFEREAFAELKLDRLDPIATLRAAAARFSCSATFVLKPVADPDEDAETGDVPVARRAEPAPRPRAPRPSAPERPAADGRARWLEALEIPDSARLDRGLVERAVARLGDLYAEEKFEHLSPDLAAMAKDKRELIARAAAELLRDLPAPPPETESEPPRPGEVRRDNPDLDSIFR